MGSHFPGLRSLIAKKNENPVVLVKKPSVLDFANCMQSMMKSHAVGCEVMGLIAQYKTQRGALAHLRHYHQAIESHSVDAALMAVINHDNQIGEFIGREIPAVTADNAALVASICMEGLSESTSSADSDASSSFFSNLNDKIGSFIDSLIERNTQQLEILKKCDASKVDLEKLKDLEVTGYDKETLVKILDAVPVLVDSAVACIEAGKCSFADDVISLIGEFGYKFEDGELAIGESKLVGSTKKLAEFGFTVEDLGEFVGKLETAMEAVAKFNEVKDKFTAILGKGETASVEGLSDDSSLESKSDDSKKDDSQSGSDASSSQSQPPPASADGSSGGASSDASSGSSASSDESKVTLGDTKLLAANIVMLVDLISQYINDAAVQMISICANEADSSSSSSSIDSSSDDSSKKSNDGSSQSNDGSSNIPSDDSSSTKDDASSKSGDGSDKSGSDSSVQSQAPATHPDGCKCLDCEKADKHVLGCQCEKCLSATNP